jgi:hypothetical protein
MEATEKQEARDESDSIAGLAAALAKAQGQFRAASKDAKNPHYGSKYADLASIWAACREPLSANGLAVMQRVATTASGVILTTMLVHSSGEWVRDRCEFPVLQKTPQAYGSAITYARRYALAALVGVAADEDDDGNAASAKAPAPERTAKKRTPEEQMAQPAAQAQHPEEPKVKRSAQAPELRNRISRLWINAKNGGATQAAFQGWCAEVLGKPAASSDWTAEDLDRLETAAAEPGVPTPPPEQAQVTA